MTRYPLCKFEVHDEFHPTTIKRYIGSGIIFDRRPIMFFETRDEADQLCKLLNEILEAHDETPCG